MIRTRAWRRFHKRRCRQEDHKHFDRDIKPEKNWKLLYLRSEKLKRAFQLGFEYPRIHLRIRLEIAEANHIEIRND